MLLSLYLTQIIISQTEFSIRDVTDKCFRSEIIFSKIIKGSSRFLLKLFVTESDLQDERDYKYKLVLSLLNIRAIRFTYNLSDLGSFNFQYFLCLINFRPNYLMCDYI